MIITDPNQIDLTGENSSYKRNLRRFKIFTANQLVDLQDAAYLNTIRVFEVTGYGADNQPVLVELDRGNYAKQWYADDSNKDITAMAKAKIRYDYESPEYLRTIDSVFAPDKTYYIKNYVSTGEYEDNVGKFDYIVYSSYTVNTQIPTNLQLYEKSKSVWDYTLVNSFYMGDAHTDLTTSGEYEIAVTYQALEIECDAIKRDGLGPEYSPGLMRSVLDKVEELYYVRNTITNVNGTTVADMHCLEEDLTGVKPENYITNEVHQIDVANDLFVIRPQCGSFYNTDTLSVQFLGVNQNEASTLEKDVDYVVTGLNKEKTAISDPDCGVYEYIIIKKSYTGKIFLSYQAFGGEVTQADINALKEIVQNVYRTVSAMDILTLSNLKDSSLIKELIYRQQLLEHTIGHFQSQSFRYKTATSDKFVNLAFVDRNPWTISAPVPTACIGEFRIKIPEIDFYLDIRVNYDLDAAEPLYISVSHIETPTFDRNKFSYFSKRIFPKFRLIWCKEEPGTERGIMLQMSMTSISNTLEYVVTIDDVTGAKSPWDLVDTRGELRPSTIQNSIENYGNDEVRYGKYTEDDNGIKTYLFDWKSSIDHSSDLIPIYPNGYTIFAGNIPIDLIELTSLNHSSPDIGTEPIELTGGYTIPPCIVGSDIDLSRVKAVEFKVFDHLTGKYLIGRSQELKSSKTSLVAEAMYFVDDLCMLSCTLEHTSGYSMKLFSRTGTNSLNNKRFSLVQIDLIG